MAINAALSYSIRGAVGRRQTSPFYLGSFDGNLTDVSTIATAFSETLDAVVDGKIEAGHILVPIVLGDVKTDPVAGSRSPDGGLLSFGLADQPYRWSVRMAAYAAALFSGADIPRTGATDALVDYLLSTISQGGHSFNFQEKTFSYNLDSFIGGELSINKL